jgi:multiple sugar transport system permease protein
MKLKQPGTLATRILLFIALLLLAFATVFPFYWMYILMTHNRDTIFTAPPPLTFGDDFKRNYDALVAAVPFWRSMWNSLYLGVVATVTALFFCSLGGFALAMYDFKYKKQIFGFIMATFLMPGILNLIPFFLIIQAFGWINEPKSLWVPGMATAFGIFMMRQFFASTMAKDLMDAARIDGATEFRIFRSIALPLVRPGLATLGLITFIGSWNNFLGPLVVLRGKEVMTVPLALRSLQGLAATTDWGAVILGSALAVTPLLLIFFLASRQIIEGLTQGAIKG